MRKMVPVLIARRDQECPLPQKKFKILLGLGKLSSWERSLPALILNTHPTRLKMLYWRLKRLPMLAHYYPRLGFILLLG
ncbi:hypothetical protein DN613_06405 [Aeromonas caviae]|nr:hypothetical protein DN613_06405 [Aeromonas caviae]